MSLPDVISTIIGAALLAILVRDVFRQLVHPEGRGRIGSVILRATRRVARRMGHRALIVAGPLSLGFVLGAWVFLAVLGWAFALAPHLPVGFSYSSDSAGSATDSLYLSLVTISTLGYGDIVPESTGMRILAPMESVMGFGLLTASLTWVLSLFAPLARHRTLSRHVHQLLELDVVDDEHLRELSFLVTQTTVDLCMSEVIYYFHAERDRDCLARVALPLREVAAERAAAGSPDARLLVRALDELAATLTMEFLPETEGCTPAQVLRAYAENDRREPLRRGAVLS